MQEIAGRKYIAYVRKSEERKERQELSHPAQIAEIKQRFPDLNIVRWMEPESKSAFTPGRPIFNEMLAMIERGDADGIVAWHPNRLARNELDAGTLTFMLRDKLKDLKFCSYNFDNSAEGIMMLQLVMSQSQYESSKQGRDVKRGMTQKASTGERPGIVPIGYLKAPVVDELGNVVRHKDKIVTRTVDDSERIDLVKRMWLLLLTGMYSAPQIRKIANEEWKFTLRKTPKTGGGPIGLSSIYRMFNNPFYAGYIMHNGRLYKGNHNAIISLEDFDYAQAIMGSRGKPRSTTNAYAYTSMIRCGVCGCSIVAKTNKKLIKRDHKLVTYVHYYCTRKSEIRPCNQSIYTSLEKLESQIDAELAKYTILPEFRDLALEILNRNHKTEATDRAKIYDMQQIKRKQVQEQIDNLVDMRTRDLLDDEEYVKKRARLKEELARLDEGLRGTEARAEGWLELTERAFDFATNARARFRDGDLTVKRDILMTLGSNLLLIDQKLTLQPREWLVPIGESYPALEAEFVRRGRTNQKAPLQEMPFEITESWRAQ